MKFDDILEKLDHKTRERLVSAALHVPRLAYGHGSLRIGQCNHAGCNRGDSHIQERIEVAYKMMYE